MTAPVPARKPASDETYFRVWQREIQIGVSNNRLAWYNGRAEIKTSSACLAEKDDPQVIA